jgi:hypothetical protein
MKEHLNRIPEPYCAIVLEIAGRWAHTHVGSQHVSPSEAVAARITFTEQALGALADQLATVRSDVARHHGASRSQLDKESE